MSLDVRLYATEGADYCEHCGRGSVYGEMLHSNNITHNLGEMADEAGIYYACWRPDEIGAVYAKDISPILEKGLELLKSDPERFEKFNSPNGWGLYEHFVPFVEEYLSACQKYPEAKIDVCR